MQNSVTKVLKLSHCKLQNPAGEQLSQTKGKWFESSGKKTRALLRETVCNLCNLSGQSCKA